MAVLFPEKGASRVFIGLEEAVRPWQEDGACWDGLRIFSSGHVGCEREEPGVGPTLGDGVSIGAGAKIISPVRIGDDVTIGANAVITKGIPNDVTVVGFNKVINEESNGRGASE
ncbi:DapH/DapD/GlmU-related protein [Slackia isoflavoniconvertens]|uniref:DapH/DapD/GlmU-related protein n=1 Tax=Slackia isoflavoniconvertens TaxID=572010 RepID=UPI003AB9B668